MEAGTVSHGLYIVRLLLHHVCEDGVGLLHVFLCLFGSHALTLGCLIILHAIEEGVAQVGLIAQQRKEFAIGFQPQLCLVVTGIEVGEFFHVGSLGFVLLHGEFHPLHSSRNVALLFGKSRGIFVVKAHIEGVVVLFVKYICLCLCSGCGSCFGVHGVGNEVDFAEEVHTAEHEVLCVECQHLGHEFGNAVELGLRVERKQEVLARADVNFLLRLGHAFIIGLVAGYSFGKKVGLVLDVAHQTVGVIIGGVGCLDALQIVDGGKGVDVFIHDGAHLEGLHVGCVEGENGVEHLTGAAPVLTLHPHFACEHQTGHIFGLCLHDFVSTELGG